MILDTVRHQVYFARYIVHASKQLKEGNNRLEMAIDLQFKVWTTLRKYKIAEFTMNLSKDIKSTRNSPNHSKNSTNVAGFATSSQTTFSPQEFCQIPSPRSNCRSNLAKKPFGMITNKKRKRAGSSRRSLLFRQF